MSFADLSALFPVVDLQEVHRALAHDAERCRAAGAGTPGLHPLALVVGADAVTILPGETVSIVDGVDPRATCVVEFVSPQAFSDFFHELRTVPGAQVSGTIRFLSGGYGSFDAWEPALRALYDGRPVYDPSVVDRSRLQRVFTFGVDDDAEIGAFVQEYGFAVVRGVFGADEIDQMNAALSRLEQESSPDTPGTWWTNDADGTPRPCQIHYTTVRAPELAWIDTDPRASRLAAACVPGLVTHPDRGNGHFAVLKWPGAKGGMTDLPWHIDCGLGGHSLSCPGLHIGIQLTPSDPAHGAFALLAGSQFSSVRRSSVDMDDSPVVVVDTSPGDVTIHVTHVLHAAPPPTGDAPGRRTLYLGFSHPDTNDVVGPGRSFDDLLSDTSDDGFVSFDDGSR